MDPRRSFLSLDSQQTATNGTTRNPFNDPKNTSPSRFDSLVAESMGHWHIPGLAIAVIDRHHIISQGYGVASLNPNNSANNGNDTGSVDITPKTLFDCASMSKSFTAAAMALLVEDEKLPNVQYQTPVSKLCREFVFENEFATENISVEDVLSHRTGVPGHDYSLRGVHHKTPDTPASVMKNFRNLAFTHPIRTKYQYNNLQFTATAHLVEKLSGIYFGDLLNEKFWKPLGMNRTVLGPDRVPEEERLSMARGYVWLADQKEHKPIPHDPEPEGIGAGSIISSVEDWARWVHAFIYRRAEILSKDSYSQLATPRILASDEDIPYLSPTFYALGWEVQYYHGRTIISHDGLWAGFTSRMLYIPSEEWGYVMMGNSEEAGRAIIEVGEYLVDELLEIPPEKRFDRRARTKKYIEKDSKKDTKEDLYPELADRDKNQAEEELPLREYAGVFQNKGYHEIALGYDQEVGSLVADCSAHAFPFRITVKERAFDYWYVAEIADPITSWNYLVRFKFDVDENGKCQRVGVKLCEDLDDLIWFERVE